MVNPTFGISPIPSPRLFASFTFRLQDDSVHKARKITELIHSRMLDGFLT
jgi:hypothetical protein